MRHQIHFYDSASPSNIPSGVWAAIYVNGFKWPEDEIKRMARIIRISVEREAAWARHARVIDIESGAATPEDAVPFIRERRAAGYHDATCYVNRSNWGDVAERVKASGLSCRWWVSTLDGTQKVADHAPWAWAVQYQGGGEAPYDVSVLHGEPDFARP